MDELIRGVSDLDYLKLANILSEKLNSTTGIEDLGFLVPEVQGLLIRNHGGDRYFQAMRKIGTRLEEISKRDSCIFTSLGPFVCIDMTPKQERGEYDKRILGDLMYKLRELPNSSNESKLALEEHIKILEEDFRKLYMNQKQFDKHGGPFPEEEVDYINTYLGLPFDNVGGLIDSLNSRLKIDYHPLFFFDSSMGFDDLYSEIYSIGHRFGTGSLIPRSYSLVCDNSFVEECKKRELGNGGYTLTDDLFPRTFIDLK